MSHPTTSSSSSIFPMADSLIVHTAEEFLDDVDVFVWARCSSTLLRAMRSYRIDRTVSMVQLLCRSEGRELLPAVTVPDFWPHHWPQSLRVRLEALLTVSRSATVVLSTPSSSSSPYSATEIGRICDVEIDSTLFADERIVTRLELLPPHVTTIKLVCYEGSHPIRISSTCTSLIFGSPVSSRALRQMELHTTNLKELLFDRDSPFNEPLEHLRLPSTLQKLYLGFHFNQPVEHIELPASLTDLILGTSEFNQPVEALRLPDGLRSLRFPISFNHPIERLKLPSSLTSLDLGVKFNHPLVEWHPPSSLTQLSLSDWQLPIDQLRLPPSLLDFTLPYIFDRPITDVLLQLPSTLRSFQSKGWFNQSLAGITQWPESLTSIKLDGEFCQPMDDWTPPPQLMTLELGRYEWPIHRLRLPPSLTSLSLSYLRLKHPCESIDWPTGLTHLKLFIDLCESTTCVIQNLPAQLKKLTLLHLFDLTTEIKQAWLLLPLPTGCQLEHDADD